MARNNTDKRERQRERERGEKREINGIVKYNNSHCLVIVMQWQMV